MQCNVLLCRDVQFRQRKFSPVQCSWALVNVLQWCAVCCSAVYISVSLDIWSEGVTQRSSKAATPQLQWDNQLNFLNIRDKCGEERVKELISYRREKENTELYRSRSEQAPENVFHPFLVWQKCLWIFGTFFKSFS